MNRVFKLVVFVPLTHAGVVRSAIGNAGGGKIGNYSHCSFSTRGIGRFKPEDGAQPHIGEVGKYEEVEEERIEITLHESALKDVIAAMKAVHPYDEVAYDVYPLESV